MTKDQSENLKKFKAAPFPCTETCARHFSTRAEFEDHVVDCRHIFPAVRAALQRERMAKRPIVVMHKPAKLARQEEMFPELPRNLRRKGTLRRPLL